MLTHWMCTPHKRSSDGVMGMTIIYLGHRSALVKDSLEGNGAKYPSSSSLSRDFTTCMAMEDKNDC